MTKRTRHTAEFKAKVALEALKEQNTLAELSSKYQVHSVQISKWKQELFQHASQIFITRKTEKGEQALDAAYRYLGEVLVERDWLKKKLNSCH
jgi:transposase